MASDPVVHADTGGGPVTNPWPALGVGLTAAALAAACLWVFGPQATAARLAFLAVGLLAAGGAVVLRPSSGLVVALAGLAAGLAWAGLNPEWDSARLLLSLVILVAFVAAVLLFLPRAVRRVVVSVFVLLHFGGILCAIGSVPPQPWLVTYVWTYFYRPYLEFMYLNNAYHFYSPDPGPASLLWFRIEYADSTARWVKLLNREDYPFTVSYQRRLSLAESTNQLQPSPPNFELRLRYRVEAGNQRGIKLHPEVAPVFQFREPNFYSKWMLRSYARHVAYTYPHLEKPDTQVTAVKIYRIVHSIPLAKDFANDQDPLDETLYLPYYQGEYDSQGNLKDPHDPFLYWLIPIVREEKPTTFRVGIGTPRKSDPRYYELKDYVKLHAGD